VAPHATLGGGGPPIGAYRDRIDSIDEVIVQLLNERAGLALRLGRVKDATGQAIYSPEREAAVIERVTNVGEGPLDALAIARLFRAIMSETRAVETERSLVGPVACS
jgi:chorismate mutase-like protein